MRDNFMNVRQYDSGFTYEEKKELKEALGYLQTNLEKKQKEQIDKEIQEQNKIALDNRKDIDDILIRVKDIQKGNIYQHGTKSFGDIFSESMQENVDNLKKLEKKEIKSFDFQLKLAGDMTFATSFGTANASVADFRPGIISNPNRKVHLRDLLPAGPMTGSVLHYLRETGNGEGDVNMHSEGADKDQLDFDLVEATAEAQYVAGFVRVSLKMLDDVPAFTAFLSNKLQDRLLRREDYQLLHGNGVSPQLKGLFHPDNHEVASAFGSLSNIEQLIKAISQLEELEREATGIVLRNSDYWDIAINKAVGSGEYDLPGVVTLSPDGILRIAGIPVSRTTAMPQDKFIVGDFQQGAMLLFRESPRIEFSREDYKNFTQNKITVKIEERVAFPVFGDNYFIYGDFGGFSS